MANSPSKVDFTQTLADFLADTISDGDWADIFNTTKVDEVGKLVAAKIAHTAIGQLWANVMDDFFQLVWELHEGEKDYDLSTSGAANDTEVLATLNDGELINIWVDVIGHATAGADVCSKSLIGRFYRDGTVTQLYLFSGALSQNNLSGVAMTLQANGNDIEVKVTGIAAKDITWKASVMHKRIVTG
jgi:hypothetical protein